MLNSPHNPTGAVLTEEDISQLRSIVKDTRILIVSDEVYEHLIFDNMPHLSMLRYPDLLERSFVCFSFGKVYNCTGWKLGYCISSPYADGRVPEGSPVQLFFLSFSFAGSIIFFFKKEGFLFIVVRVYAGKKRFFSATNATNKVYSIAKLWQLFSMLYLRKDK